MSSFNLNRHIRKVVNNYYGSGTFKMLLVTSALTETEKDAWEFRSDVTNEVANGNGYTTGGVAVTLTVAAIDTVNNDVEVTCSAGVWNSATITAAGAIVYKVIGSAATDEIIDFIDFGGNVSSTNDTFTATPSGSLKYQN